MVLRLWVIRMYSYLTGLNIICRPFPIPEDNQGHSATTASWLSWVDLYSRQSSANSRTDEVTLADRSFIYTKNTREPSTVP